MTAKRYGQAAPMPDSFRQFMRADRHPARDLPCPHCGVGANRPCRVMANGQVLAKPHPQRVAAMAQMVACCPTCQVTPTVPCHADGRALGDGVVHPARHVEADRSAA